MKPCMKLKDRCEHVCAKPCKAQCNPHCMVAIDNTEIEFKGSHVRTTLACFEHKELPTVVCPELRGASVYCLINVKEDTIKCMATCCQILNCGHIYSRLRHRCKDLEKETDKEGYGSCLQKCNQAYSRYCH
jgi:hypothetical protein